MPTLINPRSIVPEMDLPLLGGGEFNIRDAKPDNFTIIIAYRGLHCPKCKTQLQAADKIFEDLKSRGYDVVAVSMDGEVKARKARMDWELKNIPIAYDLDLMTAKAWGLFISDKREGSEEPDIFSEPGLFVVKPDGALYAEYVQNTPFGRPPLADIANGLDFVVEKGYPTRGTSTA